MVAAFVQRGGLWVLGQAALMAAVFGLSLKCRGAQPRLPLLLAGWACLGLGGLCGLAGALALGGGLTPLPKPRPQARLVQRGIYARLRHPLYLSVFLGGLGWALVWRSWPALLAALALGPFLDAKARHEERWLRAQFPEYEDYARRVRRFIPGVY